MSYDKENKQPLLRLNL